MTCSGSVPISASGDGCADAAALAVVAAGTLRGVDRLAAGGQCLVDGSGVGWGRQSGNELIRPLRHRLEVFSRKRTGPERRGGGHGIEGLGFAPPMQQLAAARAHAPDRGEIRIADAVVPGALGQDEFGKIEGVVAARPPSRPVVHPADLILQQMQGQPCLRDEDRRIEQPIGPIQFELEGDLGHQPLGGEALVLRGGDQEADQTPGYWPYGPARRRQSAACRSGLRR